MDSIEVEAKTIEEAIELGLKQLDVERDEVEIEVISKRRGLLGFGADKPRVRVSLRTDAPKLVTIAKEVADHLIASMSLSLVSYARGTPNRDDELPSLDIEGDDSGLLIGRRGESLRAFQFLLNNILSHRMNERVMVNVDVEQYRERRYQALQSRATHMAERVAATGRVFTLEPMTPAERRIIHLWLADHPKVMTESIGEGTQRKVTILPK